MSFKEAGFTLLEVMVALFIVALLAVTVSGVVGQRVDIAATVQDRDFAALCGRELLARFALQGRGDTQGELVQGGRTCFWQLVGNGKQMAGIDSAILQVHGNTGERQLLGEWPVYFGATKP
jgi:general secretion pathway protein I